MSQIATDFPRESRESRDGSPNTPAPPTTRHPPAGSAARPPATTTSTNTAGNQVSMEAALGAANGDPLVALETILNDRNSLSSQNSQLWKIIEKQRGMYNNLHKELDRVKAERDRLQGRSSGETSTKRRESTSRKQITRSHSEDRRESHYSLAFYRLESRPPQWSHPASANFACLHTYPPGRHGRKHATRCSNIIHSYFLFAKPRPNGKHRGFRPRIAVAMRLQASMSLSAYFYSVSKLR
jgi:hypothetical protein